MKNGLSPVYGYLRRPSLIDFAGSVAAVFFVSGCNFRCGFCHNADLLGVRKDGVPWEKLTALCREFRGDWVDGAVVTGGEPTLAPGLEDLLGFLKDFGFRIKLDTNGSRPEVLERVLPLLSFVAMDVKAPLDEYADLTGFGDGDAVRRSIALLNQSKVPYELRTTVIESYHTIEMMRRLAKDVSGAARYVLQPFLPREDLPREEFRQAPRTSPEHLKLAAEAVRPFVGELVVAGA